MDDAIIARIREIMSESGLTQRAFAKLIALDESKLTKSLSGTRKFTSLELALIAQQGGKSVDWILEGVAPRQIAFALRSDSATIDKANIAGAETLPRVSELYSNLASIGFAPESRDLPRPIHHWSYVEKANKLAAEAVVMLGQPLSSLDDEELFDEIEHVFGINVLVDDTPPGCDGLSYQNGDFRAMVLGTTDVAVRQRYTLAHELGHILWGHASNAIVADTLSTPSANKTEAEKSADTFAASFLMPAEELTAKLAGRRVELAFDELAFDFRVAPLALSWRLYNLNLVDSDTRARLGARTSATCAEALLKTRSLVERNRRSEERRPPWALGMAAVQAYRAGEISINPVAELLRMPVSEMDAMLNRSPGDDIWSENPEG